MNKEIRKLVRLNDLRYWQIAREVGCAPTTRCVWLREELEGERREQVLQAIQKLSRERGDTAS